MHASAFFAALGAVLVIFTMAGAAQPTQPSVLVAIRHNTIFTNAVNSSLPIVRETLFGSSMVPASANVLAAATMCNVTHESIYIKAPLRGLRASFFGDHDILVSFEGTKTLTTNVVGFRAACQLPGPLPIYFSKTGTVSYTVTPIGGPLNNATDIQYSVPFGTSRPAASQLFKSFETAMTFRYDNESADNEGTGFAADYFLRHHFHQHVANNLVAGSRGVQTRLFELTAGGGGWLSALSAVLSQFVGNTSASSFQCLNTVADLGYTFIAPGRCVPGPHPSFAIDAALVNMSLDVVVFASNASSGHVDFRPILSWPTFRQRAVNHRRAVHAELGNCAAVKCGGAQEWNDLQVNFTACTRCVESGAASLQMAANLSFAVML